MSAEKKRRASWPMEYILGGILIIGLLVLVVHGFQSVTEEKTRLAREQGKLPAETDVESEQDDVLHLPSRYEGDPYVATSESETESYRGAIVEAESEAPATPVRLSFDEAEASFHAKDFARAAMGFEAYTLEYPHNPWGHYMLGLSRWKAGDLPEAEGALRQALSESPEHFKALVNLGRVLMDQGQHDEALGIVEQAIEIDPASNAAHRVRARALHNLGRSDEAVNAYLEALRLQPEDVWSLNNIGLILIETERFEEALSPLALATRIDGETAVFQNNLGVALERCGYSSAAKEAYAKACEIDGGHEKARLSLARVELLPDEGSEIPDLAALAEEFSLALANGTVDSLMTAYAAAESAKPAADTNPEDEESASELEGERAESVGEATAESAGSAVEEVGTESAQTALLNPEEEFE